MFPNIVRRMRGTGEAVSLSFNDDEDRPAASQSIPSPVALNALVREAIASSSVHPRFMQRDAEPVEQQQGWQAVRGEWAAALLETGSGRPQPVEGVPQEAAAPQEAGHFMSHARALMLCLLIQAALTVVGFKASMEFPICQAPAHKHVWLAAICLAAAAVACLLFEFGVSFPLRKAIRSLDAALRCERLHDDKLPRKFACLEEVRQIWDVTRKVQASSALLARFVPGFVAEGIVRGTIQPGMYVNERVVTVLFADIRGFTGITEALPHVDMFQFLFRYLTVAVRLVESFQGVVAEIHGDGVLCFWNAGKAVDNHHEKACTAAVAMTQAVELLTREFQQTSLPNIKIGIGIHSGPVLSGIIGCSEKMKWGCLGDTVSLAIQIESLCKLYGVAIVCSGGTHDHLPQDGPFLCRRLDMVRLRGREEALRMYHIHSRDDEELPPESTGSRIHVMDLHVRAEAIGINGTPWPSSWSRDPNYAQFFSQYERCLLAFEGGRFDEAAGMIEDLLQHWPQDESLEVLRERVSSLARGEPGRTTSERTDHVRDPSRLSRLLFCGGRTLRTVHEERATLQGNM